MAPSHAHPYILQRQRYVTYRYLHLASRPPYNFIRLESCLFPAENYIRQGCIGLTLDNTFKLHNMTMQCTNVILYDTDIEFSLTNSEHSRTKKQVNPWLLPL
jgi:hypothetical protein